MEHSYEIIGMTCTGCTQIVHDLLSNVPGVKKVTVSLDQGMADIEMDTPMPIEKLQKALANSLYELSSELKNNPLSQERWLEEKGGSEKNKMLVSSYITAAGNWDHKTLQQYLAVDFEFKGAVHLHNANDYIKMIKEHANSGIKNIVLKTDIKAIFIDQDEACVIYDVVTSTKVKHVSFFENIVIREDKISATEVKFNRQQMKLLMKEVHELQQMNEK